MDTSLHAVDEIREHTRRQADRIRNDDSRSEEWTKQQYAKLYLNAKGQSARPA